MEKTIAASFLTQNIFCIYVLTVVIHRTSQLAVPYEHMGDLNDRFIMAISTQASSRSTHLIRKHPDTFFQVLRSLEKKRSILYIKYRINTS